MALALFLAATVVALAGLWVLSQGRPLSGGALIGMAIVLGPIGVSVLV